MKVVNPITSTTIFDYLGETTNTFTDVSSAYSAWAAELGLSDTDSLPGLAAGDDSCSEVSLNFVPSKYGLSSKVMVGSEGSFGIYFNEPGGSAGSQSRPISGVSGIHQNVTRNFNSRPRNPAVIFNCKHPTNDSRSENLKWQQTSDAAIFYVQWRSYGSSTKVTQFAAKLSHGKIDIVCSSIDSVGAYLQCFLFDESQTSAIAIEGEGNFSEALAIGQVRYFTSQPPKRLTGNVFGADALPTAATVRAYDRDSGELRGEQISDAATGAYDIAVSDGEYYLVCLDASGAELNALIFDRVISVD
ncbi:hypothetical protein [Shewanella algae]|uniref:hypothetical protein n=1 Tax=Shewanella algae TaxID=38313 RepID=UPI001AAD2AFB|nr:hypothetical protein [Shewanella algae]MBO2563810.1 hypothetical protein [Shewanella algae]